MRFRRGNAAELERGFAPLPGEDGWLFLHGDSNDVIAQHTGTYDPDRRWERSWARILRRRARLMRRLGPQWVFCVSPDKEAVYADKLPPEIRPIARRPIDRLRDRGRAAGVEILYPLDELRAARSRRLTYFPTDSHWTPWGAFVTYRVICDELVRRGLRLPVLDEERVRFAEKPHAGDLGSKLEPPLVGPGLEATVADPAARTVSDNLVRVTGRRIVVEAPLEAPSCVVFGTSYAIKALPFLAESFRRLVLVHTTAIDRATLEDERPEVVLTLTAERGLRRPPDDRGADSMLAETIERKRAAGILIGEDEPRPEVPPPA